MPNPLFYLSSNSSCVTQGEQACWINALTNMSLELRAFSHTKYFLPLYDLLLSYCNLLKMYVTGRVMAKWCLEYKMAKIKLIEGTPRAGKTRVNYQHFLSACFNQFLQVVDLSYQSIKSNYFNYKSKVRKPQWGCVSCLELPAHSLVPQNSKWFLWVLFLTGNHANK